MRREIELEQGQHAPGNARGRLRTDLASARALIESLGVGIALNPERAKSETVRGSSSAFEQLPAVAAPDQRRIDEQMPELGLVVGEALERIETDDDPPELHQLEHVVGEKVRADRQLGTAAFHEVRGIAPASFGPKREIRQERALLDARGAEHVTELSARTRAALIAAFFVLSCTGAQDAAQAPPASPPAPRETAPSEPAPSVPDADSSAAIAPKPDERPPPLGAGGDAGLPASSGVTRSNACAPDTVRRTLEGVVGECKRQGQRVCGELKVRASEDGGNIRVALDITNDSFDDSFSRCITSRLNGVAWRCALPGSDITLDLGCDL
jgi:hypothetical protein